MDLEVIKIMLTVLGTALTTFYTVLNPRKQAMWKQQLESIYLPLIHETQFRRTPLLDNNDLVAFFEKFENIIKLNYQLVTPQLDKLYSIFLSKLATESFDSNIAVYNEISTYISSEFDNCKAKLGLPTKSTISRFRHFNNKQKVNYILDSLANAFVGVVCVFMYSYLISTLFDETKDTIDRLVSLLLLTGTIFIIYILLKYLYKSKK